MYAISAKPLPKGFLRKRLYVVRACVKACCRVRPAALRQGLVMNVDRYIRPGVVINPTRELKRFLNGKTY